MEKPSGTTGWSRRRRRRTPPPSPARYFLARVSWLGFLAPVMARGDTAWDPGRFQWLTADAVAAIRRDPKSTVFADRPGDVERLFERMERVYGTVDALIHEDLLEEAKRRYGRGWGVG